MPRPACTHTTAPKPYVCVDCNARLCERCRCITLGNRVTCLWHSFIVQELELERDAKVRAAVRRAQAKHARRSVCPCAIV